MNAFRFRLRSAACALAIFCVGATAIGGATSGPAGPATSKYAGFYIATHLNGTSVVRLELSLEPSGRAQLRSGASRYTQRPTAMSRTPVIETGTWRERGGRAVLHIEKYISGQSNSDEDKPSFADRTFVLTGCELRLVGSGFIFDKRHCN